MTERLSFALCRILGALVRRARYAETHFADEGGRKVVRKHRVAIAPLVVWLANPVVRWLGTGVRVLPHGEWDEKERAMYQALHGETIRVEGKTLVLPRLPGRTLAEVLEDASVPGEIKQSAIGLAAKALVELHQRGLSHGDAMAENVLVDLQGNVARWIDFETVHDDTHPFEWRRADDVRALLATSALRAEHTQRPGIVRVVLDRYADASVRPAVMAFFVPAFRPALVFHLGQAPLSFDDYRAIARELAESRS